MRKEYSYNDVDGMMGGFGMVFGLLYLEMMVYFFLSLKSLTRIADRLDRLPERGQQGDRE